MKSLRNNPTLGISMLVAAGLLILHLVFGIPSGEGFNPSDEGVVLAQSWRLLQGEVPHGDFISLRPAGSGYFHLIDFLLPGQLIIASKYFTLIEYLFYSIIISYLLVFQFFADAKPRVRYAMFAGSAILASLLNINHYNLFAWTTIDALFWFSIAIVAYYRSMESEGTKKSWWVFAAVASAVAAALCRQTFALPSALLMIMLLVKSIRDRRVSVFFAYGAGLLPGIAYLVMLLLTGSLDDFIAQMTGRTELWETGVTKFVNAFWHSPVIWLTILLIGTLLIKIWYQETSKKTDRIVSILVAQKYIIIIGMILSSYLVFILPEHLFSLSLLMFWLTVAGFLLVTGWGGQVKGKGVMGWMILIAWTSSISAGDNAPVFSLGILAASSVLFIIRHLPPVRFKKPVEYLAAILLTIMAGWYVKAQKDNNYRDLPSNQLTVEGGSIFGDIKGVRLNPSTASYLSDLKKMYQSCGEPEGRFAIWPNNAVLYRILGSPNPFPLDWMQGPEFAGSEERVMKEVADKLTREDLFVLVEKYNVKWIAREKIPLDWSSGDYPYLRLLDSLYREVPSGSEWFRLFVRK